MDDAVAAIVATDNGNRELRHTGCFEGHPVVGYVKAQRPHPVDFSSHLEYQVAVDSGGWCLKCGQRIERVGF